MKKHDKILSLVKEFSNLFYEIKELKTKRSILYDNCSNLGIISEIPKDKLGDFDHLLTCRELIWKFKLELYPYDHNYMEYREIIFHHGCERCNEAWKLSCKIKEKNKRRGIVQASLTKMGVGI